MHACMHASPVPHGRARTHTYACTQGLKKAKEVRTQLADLMAQQKMPLTTAGNDWDVVRKAICSAYFQVRWARRVTSMLALGGGD